MTTPMSWQDLCDSALPDHDTELMSSHQGRPTPEQHIANGATAPPGNSGGGGLP